MRLRRTDYGTVVLHWTLVAAFVITLVTGLRIAAESPKHSWLSLFERMLPRDGVWTAHIQAGLVLVAVWLAYAVYMIRSGLRRRVQLDKVRLHGLFGRRQARWGAINVLLYWVFYVALSVQIVTGSLLYFGYLVSHDVLLLHWYGTWVIIAYIGLHVLAQWALGGIGQLLRITRPAPIVAPSPPLDVAELLTLLAEQPRPSAPAGSLHSNELRRQAGSAGSQARGQTVQANAFAVAAATAIAGTMFVVAIDRQSVHGVQIRRIVASETPVLDGDTSDWAWRMAKPYSVMTNQGGNFDGKGETRIDIRAVHDGAWVYFLFSWDDPTRSLKQLPLVKRNDGWHLLHDGYDKGDEHSYNEDKFSVLLTTADTTLAGGSTFHAGPQPIPDAPATLSRRGLHYTTDRDTYADVWQWKASSGGAAGYMDDNHFGPPLKASEAQARGIAPYKGGFAPDPGTANYSNNFGTDIAGGYSRLITPRRLPRNLAATQAALGRVDLNPNHGEGYAARWFMNEAESVPYTFELDARIPAGTVIPGVIVAGEFSGDHADVRCAASWAAGRWALEVTRRLDTNSKYDVPVKTGTFMRVAAFDHSQIRHTRHVRPIRIEVE